MPGHIPVCLFIRLSGLFVDQFDSPEQKDYDWIVGRHQHLSWTSHFLADFRKLCQTLMILPSELHHISIFALPVYEKD